MSENLLNIAIEVAIEAGKRILEIYEEDNFETVLKADDTPITKADKAAHEIITKRLWQTGIPIVSEEGKIAPYEQRKHWQQFWLVDPLDGTKEFVKKNGEFTVNIAMIESGEAVLGVIYVPVSRELYYGKVGAEAVKARCENGKITEIQYLPLLQNHREHCVVVASRSFKDAATENYIESISQNVKTVSRGSSLKLCMIAEGSADVYPRFVNLKEWDIAAGVAIVSAADGTVINAKTQERLVFNSEDLKVPYFIAERNRKLETKDKQ